VGLFLRPFLGV
jgi:hypothetical protein